MGGDPTLFVRLSYPFSMLEDCGPGFRTPFCTEGDLPATSRSFWAYLVVPGQPHGQHARFYRAVARCSCVSLWESTPDSLCS